MTLAPRTARLVLLLPALAACSQGATLQPDHGASFEAAFVQQSDLSRASVAKVSITLSGEEALLLRENLAEDLTNEPGEDNLTLNLMPAAGGGQ